MKYRTKFLALLVIASALLAACGGGASSPIDDVPYRARLFPSHEEELLPEPIAGRVTTTHYLSGGTATVEWRVDMADETLADDFTYSLVMASASVTTIDLELILEVDGEEVVIAEDSFVIDSDRYMPYRGTLTPTEASESEGDTLMLRMEASGGDYGMQYGGLATYLSVFEAPEMPDEVLEQRTAMLMWFVDNISVGEEGDVVSTELFENTVDQVDFTIQLEENGLWHIGWGLTNSETPFKLTWENNVFTAEELTQAQAGEADLEEMQIQFEIE
ncbi:MAG: hypothetical protein PVG63_03950 [Anaerolineales bacterium]|jgi:hypothetical protein